MLWNQTRDFASRAVNLAKLSHIFCDDLVPPDDGAPQRSRGGRGIVTPLSAIKVQDFMTSIAWFPPASKATIS